MFDKQDWIDFGLHALWALWILGGVLFLPLFLVPVWAMIPREGEQLYHAVEWPTPVMKTPVGASFTTLRDHVSDERWVKRKAFDFGGYLLGGIIGYALLRALD